MNTPTEITEKVQNPPVSIAEVKPTNDPEIFQLRLEQIPAREVNNANALLGFTMAGHSNFSSSRPRTMYQNFSKTKITELGLATGGFLPTALNAKLVVHEFCEGDIIPENLKEVSTDYKGKTTFVARVWADKNNGGLPVKQSPKLAGKNGEVLTFNGKPIYRNVYLTIDSMCQEDHLIQHNNVIVGSTQQGQMDNQQGATQQIGEPAIPAETEIA